jgi:uncharacterized protein (UPF0248 family)
MDTVVLYILHCGLVNAKSVFFYQLKSFEKLHKKIGLFIRKIPVNNKKKMIYVIIHKLTSEAVRKVPINHMITIKDRHVFYYNHMIPFEFLPGNIVKCYQLCSRKGLHH